MALATVIPLAAVSVPGRVRGMALASAMAALPVLWELVVVATAIVFALAIALKAAWRLAPVLVTVVTLETALVLARALAEATALRFAVVVSGEAVVEIGLSSATLRAAQGAALVLVTRPR